MKQQWEEVLIKTDDSGTQQGIAPVIISASTATDIPAFHSRWFINHLEKEHIRWENRFSPTNPKYISLKNVRLIVFWARNSAPIIPVFRNYREQKPKFLFPTYTK